MCAESGCTLRKIIKWKHIILIFNLDVAVANWMVHISNTISRRRAVVDVVCVQRNYGLIKKHYI